MGAVALLILVALVVLWVASRSRSRAEDGVSSYPASATDERVSSHALERDDGDSWEGGFWDASDPRDLDASIELTYTDAEGMTTTRVVRIRSYDNKLYGGTLIGYCHLRDATRTFRFDRVRHAVDVTTGEVIGDLREHLNRLYARSPQGARETLLEEHQDVLGVLLFVAKADGQFREAEKLVVRAHLRDLAGDPRMTDEMIDRLLREMTAPSLHAFKLALGRIVSRQLVDPRRLQEVCQQIVATQKTVSAGEREALDYIAARVSRQPVVVARPANP